MNNFESMVELLLMLFEDPRFVVLLGLLVIAAVTDCRSYKIPNWLTFGGLTFGLIYSIVVPFSVKLGFLWALGGAATGFFIMLPLYALGMLGAGDVKLMAMTGAFLGVDSTVAAVVFSLIVGGVAALGFSLFKGALGKMLGNVKKAAQMMVMSAAGGFKPEMRIAPAQSVGKLPYAVCIGVGTVASLVARQLGFL
jgi:prepilin peptidase CpaA